MTKSAARSTPGKLADLAVLTKDYLTCRSRRSAASTSLLTMVGGRVVFGAGPYAALEDKAAD